MHQIWLTKLMGLLNPLNRKSSFHPRRNQCTCLGYSGITTTIPWLWAGVLTAPSRITKSLTQRLILSLVSKVYDPIGLVAPFTVGARLILKKIWRVNGQSWDGELPKDTIDRFLACCVELPQLAQITIPRSYFSGPFQHLELQMFADSSQDVFSAVGFLRVQVTCTYGKIATELAFVLCKVRVAPMKVMKVPKL